jgi:hypothetical protein
MEETISEVSLRRSNPAGYLRTFLANEIRPDGRKPNARRPIGERKHPLHKENSSTSEHIIIALFSLKILRRVSSRKMAMEARLYRSVCRFVHNNKDE